MSIDLLDYRRQVFSHYAQIRSSELPSAEQAELFRSQRDELFANHPQSALSEKQKKSFSSLNYFDYNPDWNKTAHLDFNIEHSDIEMELIDDGTFRMQRLAYAHFVHDSTQHRLTVFWLLGYGGGLFLPFRDESRKSGEIYPGSRYLIDTIKGADLGNSKAQLNLDFNYAYNPSCAYNELWDCPLAPQENWLDIAVMAGEKDYPHQILG